MPTILVADDNSNIQKMVSLAFQDKGIRVVAVGNGEAACRKVPEVRPDVVLADVFMPVRNGYEVCEFVKQDPEFAETPVILLVGAFDPLDEKEAARVGANGVLKKPFVPPDPLISLVSSLLGKDMPAEPEAQAPTPAPEHPVLRNVQYTTPRPEPPKPPQEFAFGSDGDDSTEMVAASAEPVAMPSPTPEPQNEEFSDDALGPENAWAQRRKAMDYEIDASDSADLVERLAGTKSGSDGATAEETEILATDKHLPFGGANVPEPPPARKWSDFLKPKPESAAPTPVAPPPEPPAAEAPAQKPAYSYDAAPPELEIASEKPEIAADLAPSELLSSGEDVIPFRPPVKSRDENDSPEESAKALTVESGHDSNVFEISATPTVESQELEIESSAPAPSWFQTQTDSASKSRVPLPEPAAAKTQSVDDEIVPSLSASEVTYGTSVDEIESSATENEASAASSVEEVSPNSVNADDKLVDDMVAKVISKLEPQLHQALKDGVLKPLVQELLNEKRGKK